MNFSENPSLALQQALAGDKAAWDAFFTLLWPVVTSVIDRKVKMAKGVVDAALVDDITQNVFVQLMEDDARRLRRFDPKRGALESFIAKIASNCTFDYLRTNARHFRNIEISSLPETAAPDDFSLPMIEEWEMAAALQTLTPREKETIELLYKHDMDVIGVAEHMAISPDTVRSTKSHALKKLKKFFGWN